MEKDAGGTPALPGGVLGLCLLCGSILWWVWPAPPALPPVSALPVAEGSTARSAFEGALREAQHRRLLARVAILGELEAREAADPEGGEVGDAEVIRKRLMGEDRSGHLRRAQTALEEAAALARTPREKCRAAEVRVLVECDLGHHDRELAAARELVALRPRSPRALRVLRRAAGCGGLTELRREIDAALETQEE